MINNFIKVNKIEEALKYKSKNEYTIIAGGTDLIVKMRSNRSSQYNILDISSTEELKNIEKRNENIIIGSLCTHSQIEKNSVINNEIPILAKGCSFVGSTLIRNRGTIGGNIINNSNCADSVPPLFILNAKLNIEKLNDVRQIDIKDLYLENGKVDLKSDEILTSIEIQPFSGYKWDLIKVGRRKSLAISRLTLAIAIKMHNGLVEDLRIYPGAMLSKPQRLYNTETFAKDNLLDMHLIEEIGERAVDEVINISGNRWSSEYKNPVLKKLIIRTLGNLMNK